jgi:hypothetical protein
VVTKKKSVDETWTRRSPSRQRAADIENERTKRAGKQA